MQQIGKEFTARFKDAGIIKLLPSEHQGSHLSVIMTGLELKCSCDFCSKYQPLTLKDDLYRSKVFSFTKQTETPLRLNKHINSSDKALVIDDFLANGQAALGLIDLIHQANAEVVSGVFVD